ncbi:MAG: diguanylate cyclase [Terracidiphilus sp.]|nr:diguanylate cyclase [Terracidiphilus sp.]
MRKEAQKLGYILKTLVCGIAVLGIAVPSCHPQHYSFSEPARGQGEALGNLNVNCIAQDRQGYLWVGTENGLYRYDGRQFKEFGAGDGLHGRTIQSLFAGLDGTLFVGTTTGIYFERHNGSFAEVHPPAPVNQFAQRIGTVFTARTANQVVAADRSGAYLLRHREPEEWVAEPLHLEGAIIWSVQYGPGGELWYGCDSDLCRLANGKTTHLGAALNLPKDDWLHLQVARDGHIWVRGASNLGEVIPAENRFELHELPGASNGAPYEALAEDARGRMIASQGPSFGVWDKRHWRMVSKHNGLWGYDLSALFVDREGSIWIGVVGHGLLRWVGQDRWEAYTTSDGLSDNIVWSSLRDRNGRLWIGTESGLDSIPPGGNTAKAWRATGIQTARAVSLAESADGSIWMGSAAGSLVRIDAKTLAGKQWKVPEVYRVLSDGAHRVWVATAGGLYMADTAAGNRAPQQVKDAAIAHPGMRFTDLSLDSANRLWTASDDGLYRLDGSGWRHIDPGLSGVKPYQIAAGHDGNVWVAGAFPGVMRLHIAGDRIIESEHISRPRLLSEQVVSLAVDHRGWVWLGQDAGMTVYDGRSWRSFTQDDGLIWNDTDAYALAEDNDGSMWIGTSGGISHLMEPQATTAGPLPAPVFSQVTFGAATIANGTRMAWSVSPLSISIASLSFRDAQHIRIRYRLLGLETEWVETAEKSVRYPRLEPGVYRFQAIAVDAANGTLSPVAEIGFRITPRWWQNGFLKLGLILLASMAVTLAWWWRIRLLIRQKRQLEQAVQHRTEDLEREKAELLHAREQMRHYAEHDDLTGLWNHRIIVERLRGEVDRAHRDGSPLSVILVDLDHFKNINDTFGHPAGDLVLKKIGAIFANSVRSYDWVGRYGGEEFLLILPGSGCDTARIRAEQLRMAVESARILDGARELEVTASFGVASGFPPGYEEVIHAVDAALYRAKHNGRNCVMATEIQPAESSTEPLK